MERREAFTFRTLTSIMIAGLSGCGKTVFTTNLLLENPDVFSTTPHTIHYCYGSWQHGFELLKQHGVQFHEGVPNSNLLPKWFPKGGILALDDLMNEGSSDQKCFGFIYHRFPSSTNYCDLPVSRSVSVRKICQNHITQCPLHHRFQKPT